MELARRLPLTRQVLADQLETATPAQTGVHARVDERRDRIPGTLQTRATARTGRSKEPGRLRLAPCASPSTTGGRHWNPSTSSSTRRTWSCSALPAPARPTWPSRWPGRPAWRGVPTRFFTAAELVMRLLRANAENRLDREPATDRQGQAPGRRRARIHPDRRGRQPPPVPGRRQRVTKDRASSTPPTSSPADGAGSSATPTRHAACQSTAPSTTAG